MTVSPAAGSTALHELVVPAESRRELAVAAMALVGISRLVDGPLAWFVGILVLVTIVVGTLQVLGPGDPRGVPVESLLLPGVAAVASVAAIRLVDPGLLLLPALAIAGILVNSAVLLEGRMLVGATHGDEDTRILGLAMLLGFLAFAGIAGAIPGGLAEPVVAIPGTPAPPLSEQGLLLLAAADGLIAGLIGYRLAALRRPTLRAALWGAFTFAVAIGIAAVAIRAAALPRFVGPALLTLVLYLWNAVQAARPTRSARWIWELILLAGLAVVILAWNALVSRA